MCGRDDVTEHLRHPLYAVHCQECSKRQGTKTLNPRRQGTKTLNPKRQGTKTLNPRRQGTKTLNPKP